MKNILRSIIFVCITVTLFGCSTQSTTFDGGEFVCYLAGEQDTTDIPIQFDQNGTGFETIADLSVSFNWSTSGRQLIIEPNNEFNRLVDFAIFDSYEYRNGYIVPTEAAYTGKLPNKDTFSATINRSCSDGGTEHMEFHKDGSVSYWQQDFTDSKDTKTYTRDGDFIVVTDGEYTKYFLVADGTMYISYFCPVDKLPENL